MDKEIKKNDKKNVIIGRADSGDLVSFANESKMLNAHVSIFGGTGTGKSTLGISLALQRAQAGEKVLMFNWHSCLEPEHIMAEQLVTYQDAAEKINVEKDGISLPLFQALCDREGNKEDAKAVNRRVAEIISMSCRLTALQSHEIFKAVECLSEEGFYSKTGLHEIINFLEAQDCARSITTAKKISPLCYDNVIHDGNFMETDYVITEVDLNGLNFDAQGMFIEFVLYVIYYEAVKGYFLDRHLTIYIDECQNLDFSDGSVLNRYLNESRKLGLSLILITPQAVGKGRKKDMSVLHQCGTRCYFRPLVNERRDIANCIAAGKDESDKWMYHLANMEKGRFIACGSFCRNGEERDMALRLSAYVGS